MKSGILLISIWWLIPAAFLASQGEGFTFQCGQNCCSSTSSTKRSSTSTDEDNRGSSRVRFLGRGKDAIVRRGVVLLSPPDEFHHFLRQAAVFIYAMGEDDNGVYVVRGVILDHPTPFNLREMMAGGAFDGDAPETSPSDQGSEQQDFLNNLLFRGGEYGGQSAFMLHCDEELGQKACNGDMIGTSGIYEGGMEYAVTQNYDIDPSKVKFFFNYMEFTEIELETMLGNRDDPQTQWTSVEVPPELVLSSEYGRGEAWARLRNAVRQQQRQ